MANKHASLDALFTDIADVIREKTGETGTIAAAQIPSMIRNKLQAAPIGVTILGLKLLDLDGNIISEDTSEAFLATRTEGYKFLSKNMQNDLMACYDIVMSDNFSIGDLYPEFEGYSVHDVYALSDAKGNINPCLEEGAILKIRVYFEVPPFMNFAILRFDGDIGELVSMPDDYIEYRDFDNDINIVLSTITGVFVILTKEG